MTSTATPFTATSDSGTPLADEAVIQPFRWTRQRYAQLRDAGILGEDDRVELIEGELIEMSPKKAPHRVAVGLADDALRQVFDRGYHVQVQDPLALGPGSEPEPDLAVIRGDRRAYLDDHPPTAALIVEVADTSLQFDRQRKGSLYALAGIPEYWIVNLTAGVVEVYRDPAPDRTAIHGASYTQRQIVEPEGAIAPLAAPGRQVRAADLLP